MGAVAGRRRDAARLLAGLVLGVATMYAGGVAQLVALTGAPPAAVVAMGVTPFLVGDVTKVVLAFLVVRFARLARRAGS